MTVTEELQRWHDTINHGKSKEEIEEMYRGLVKEESGEAEKETDLFKLAKELCDVIVTCHPLLYIDEYRDKSDDAKRQLTSLGIVWEMALHKVNQSNFSKLIREEEIEEAQSHFLKKGIFVDIVELEEGIFGAVSQFDQRVKKKEYAAGKILKGPKYADIDTSIEWWM